MEVTEAGNKILILLVERLASIALRFVDIYNSSEAIPGR